MAQLNTGTRIEASIITVTGGRVEINTPLGKVTAETSFPLTANQSLTLQVPYRSSNAGFQLQILDVAGKPVQTGNAPQSMQGQGAQSTAPQISQTITPTTLTMTTGSTVLATVINPTSSSGMMGAGTGLGTGAGVGTGISAGNALTGTVSPNAAASSGQIAPPNSGTLTAQTTPQTSITNAPLGQPSNQAPSSPAPLTTSPSAQAGQATQTLFQTPLSSSPTALLTNTIPPGTQFSITITNLTPPKAEGMIIALPSGPSSTPNIAPISTGSILTGMVVGLGSHGTSIVSTSNIPLSLSVATTQSLPVGTEVTFTVASQPKIPAPQQPMPSIIHREGMIMNQSWPSLDDGLATLQSAAPQMVEHITNHILPKPNAQFTAMTLFFLSALKGGEVKDWLGSNATKILAKAKPGILQKLGEEFKLLGRSDDDVATPTRTDDWRGTLIPLLSEDGLQQIRFFSRNLSDDEDNDEQNRKGQRFLIDLNLSKIGRLQLDGIVEKGEKRLDMIIRTSVKLPDEVRANIMTIFASANEIVGMNGGMSFQAAPDAFIDPELPDEKPQTNNTGIGITV